MAESADVTVQQLFKQWRSGDAEAGATMAQRFSNWYYAVTAVRLGDKKGKPPLEKAYQNFESGIMEVTRPGDLVEWAYSVVRQQINAAGGRSTGADIPNAITRNRPPSRLLREIRPGLDPDQIQLLHLVYTRTGSEAEVARIAEGQGGMPLGLLRARYTLKRLLKTEVNVPFQETPLELNFDRMPLPLYEAGQLASDDEEVAFEKWMLTDPELCRDVAEFATFALALRAGCLLSEDSSPAPPEPAATPEARPVQRPTPQKTEPVREKPPEVSAPVPQGPNIALFIGIGVGVLIVLVLAFLLLR